MMRRIIILLLLIFISSSTIFAQEDESLVIRKNHNPKKATLYSAVLPGLGQFYNKKYWKIPIVYAGIGTIYYFAHTNNEDYKTYRKAYDFKTGSNPNVSDKIKDIADHYTADNLITLRDYYRRNMELSWIIMAVWYGINIIDATVDAHFFYYDINDDLSLKIEPVLEPAANNFAYGYGQTGVSLKIIF